MSENLINEELNEEIIQDTNQTPIEDIEVVAEEVVEEVAEEVIEAVVEKPKKKKKAIAKKESSSPAKVVGIIRKRPRTVILKLEDGSIVEVPKANFDKTNKVVKL